MSDQIQKRSACIWLGDSRIELGEVEGGTEGWRCLPVS
jgi:hypothetical protein